MKKYFIIPVCLILWSFISSCSAVFDAGVSGQIFEYDGKTGLDNVTVYVYGSKEDRQRDYDGYINRTSNRDFNGNFIPSEDLYIPRATTDSTGKFEISKIVWSTTKPMFGKTDDIHTVYLLFYKDGLSITPNDSPDSLICWPESCKIVSSSSNPSMVKLSLCCKEKYFNGISGFVRSEGSMGLGNAEDNGAMVSLYYCDANGVVANDDGTITYRWFSGIEQNKKNAKKMTESTPFTSNGDYISYGNYIELGRDAKFDLIFDSPNQNPLSKEDGYVYFYIKYENPNDVNTRYSEPIKVYSSNFSYTYNVYINSMKTDEPIIR